MPPARFATRATPAFARIAAPIAERCPVWHTTTTGLSVAHLGDARAQLVERDELRACEVTELAVELRPAAHVEHVNLVAMARDPLRGDLCECPRTS